jgi:uncharacterized DUF497 family protein
VHDDDVEWDDAKATPNWLDHGVRFETAREVFKDFFAIEWADEGQDDAGQRFITVGRVENRPLYASYTLRGDRIRIISARGAGPCLSAGYRR